jgi:hypothetical protein
MSRLRKVQEELRLPENAKYWPLMGSFWSLTRDEQANVLAKHSGIRRFNKLLTIETRIMAKMLSKSLEVGYSTAPDSLVKGSALMVQDLGQVLLKVTFDDKNLRLWKSLK